MAIVPIRGSELWWVHDVPISYVSAARLIGMSRRQRVSEAEMLRRCAAISLEAVTALRAGGSVRFGREDSGISMPAPLTPGTRTRALTLKVNGPTRDLFLEIASFMSDLPGDAAESAALTWCLDTAAAAYTASGQGAEWRFQIPGSGVRCLVPVTEESSAQVTQVAEWVPQQPGDADGGRRLPAGWAWQVTGVLPVVLPEGVSRVRSLEAVARAFAGAASADMGVDVQGEGLFVSTTVAPESNRTDWGAVLQASIQLKATASLAGLARPDGTGSAARVMVSGSPVNGLRVRPVEVTPAVDTTPALATKRAARVEPMRAVQQ